VDIENIRLSHVSVGPNAHRRGHRAYPEPLVFPNAHLRGHREFPAFSHVSVGLFPFRKPESVHTTLLPTLHYPLVADD
jgi:hypothetical protein